MSSSDSSVAQQEQLLNPEEAQLIKQRVLRVNPTRPALNFLDKNRTKQILENLQSWRVQFLQINRLCREELPQSIPILSFISMENLGVLVLSNNLIESTELLCRIQAPNLHKLVLRNNNFIRLTIKKAYFPRLEIIDASNQMTSIKNICLQEDISKLCSPSLKTLDFGQSQMGFQFRLLKIQSMKKHLFASLMEKIEDQDDAWEMKKLHQVLSNKFVA